MEKILHLLQYNITQRFFFLSCAFLIALISDQSSHISVCFESHVICRKHLLHNNVIAHLNSRGFYTSVNINTMQMMIYWFSFIYDLLFIASCRANVKCSLCSSNTERGCRTIGSAILYTKRKKKKKDGRYSTFLQFILWFIPSSIYQKNSNYDLSWKKSI